jgi:hypothetical protein
VLHFPAICEAVRGTAVPAVQQQAADFIWRLVLVEVDEFLAAGPAAETKVDGTAYGAVVLGVIPFMLEAIEEIGITTTNNPVNAYATFMMNIDLGLREPWTRDGVEALRRLFGAPSTVMDPAQEEPKQIVLLGRALVYLAPEEARLVRKVVCELLPLPPADMPAIVAISPAFAKAVAKMRWALEADPRH